MSLTDAYEADLRGLDEELENQDVFAPGEAEAWYDRIDEDDVISDDTMVNETFVDVLDDRDGVDRAIQTEINTEIDDFF